MRYKSFFKKVIKNRSENERKILEKAFTTINAECDKYSIYIHESNNILLFKSLASYCDKQIIIKHNENLTSSFLEKELIYRRFQSELLRVVDEILKEKTREIPSAIKKKHIAKMFVAYNNLALFKHEILEPLDVEDPCIVKADAYSIWLEYDATFYRKNEVINCKIDMERAIAMDFGECKLKQRPKESLAQMTETDHILNVEQNALELRATWLFPEEEELTDYTKNNRILSRILLLLDTYYSVMFTERFKEYCWYTPGKTNQKSLYKELRRQWLKGCMSKEIEELIDCRPEAKAIFNDLIARNNIPNDPMDVWRHIPLCVRNKDQLYTDEYFKLGDKLKELDRLVLDLDTIKSMNEKDVSYAKTPILKTSENGDEEYIIVPCLLSNLEYEKTVYYHIINNSFDKSLQKKVSMYMEKRVANIFKNLKDVHVINKEHITIEKNNFDFDALIIDSMAKKAILIEYKHSMEFRKTVQNQKKFMKNQLNKAALQLEKRLMLITKYSDELEAELGLPKNSLSNLDIFPLLVSNSMEYDREYFSFSSEVTVNGKKINKAQKISYFELMMIIDHIDLPREELTLSLFLDCIDNNEFWKGVEDFIPYSSMSCGEKVYYSFNEKNN